MLNLYDAVREIHEQQLPYANKYVQYRELLEQTCRSMLRSETIRLSDDFSRLSFLAKRQNLTDAQRFGLWHVWQRPKFIRSGQFQPTDPEYLTDLKALVWGLAALIGEPIPADFRKMLSAVSFPKSQQRRRGEVVKRIRVVFRSREQSANLLYLLCDDEDNPSEEPLRVRINDSNLDKSFFNDEFKESVGGFWPGASLHLVDVLVLADEPNVVVPRFIVLEPDYLINVTDLAETFTDYGNSPLYYLMKKLEPMPNKKSLLLGNMANFFLDELLNEATDQRHHFLYQDPQTGKYSGLFLQGFSQQPFAFTTCPELQTNEDFNGYRAEAEAIFVRRQPKVDRCV